MERIPIKAKVEIRLDSPLHVGGGKGVDSVCSYLLRGGDGQPFWPGSAFKGKTRHFARLLLEGSGETCSFNHTLATGDDNSNCNCLVCDMMGSAGNNHGGLLFGDMKFAGSGTYEDVRTGNTIDRYRRVTNDNALFGIETAGSNSSKNNEENLLTGEITGTLSKKHYDREKELLVAAIQTIPYIGGNTGRGLGWVQENGVKVEVKDIGIKPEINKPEPSVVTLPVTLTSKSPLLIGTKTTQSNFRTTQYHIPGSVMRAALAQAIIAQDGGLCGEKINWIVPKVSNSAFPSLRKAFEEIHITQFLPKGCRFAPITAEKYKYNSDDEAEHTHDTLRSKLGDTKDDWSKEPRKERVKDRFIYSDSGTVAENPLSMVITKSAVNRYQGTTQDEMFFSMETLVPPVTFCGFISGEFDPEELRKLVKNGISVGGYQTSGYGQCSVEIGEQKTRAESKMKLCERVKKFGSRIPVTLLSDALINDLTVPLDTSNEGYLDAFRAALFPELPLTVKLVRVFAQHSQWRGFNTSEKTYFLNPAVQVIKAGAVFVLEAQKWTDEALDSLELLEKNGISKGIDAANGFGQIVVADKYHLNEMGGSDMSKEQPKVEKDAIDEMKPELIGIVKKLFEGKQSRDIPDKRQYSSLVQAAEHSACVEELTLLIRYKSVKEGSKSGWKYLAEPLAKAIEELESKAKKIAKKPDGDDESNIVKYHMQLTRLLLGYLMWQGCVIKEQKKNESN
ncbi:MAG: RAMP superfamily CRISPR-associated protein [Clostridiales bacterium]|nr:RAMP superfamily CRISPR-associated protein [Clostridiales bacterium]